jgi:photosystem II stability/assembly factor-like uncharacterized protein
MKKTITIFALLLCAFCANGVSAQFLVKPTFFETLGVSDQGLVSGYVDQGGQYSIWNPEENLFYEIGGAAPGLGVGGAAKFSADGKYLSGTSYISQAISTDWHRNVEPNFNYIFKEVEFPENQQYYGFAAGESLTYNGNGILLKTFDGGQHWSELWVDNAQHGLEAMSFPTLYTGYVGGWNGFLAKTDDGGNTWNPIVPSTDDDVWFYRTIDFKDELNGVVTAQLEDGFVGYYTTDGGQTWTTSTGLSGIVEKACYAGGNTYFAVNMAGDIQKSADGGASWTTVYTAPGMLVGVRFHNQMTGIATSDQYCYKTTDGGATWTQYNVQEGVMFRDVNWIDDMNLVIAGSSDVIFASNDGGATWTWDNQNLFNGEPSLYSIAVTSENVVICGSQGNFYKKSLISSQIVAEMSRYNMTTQQWTPLGNLGQTVDATTSGGYCISADGNTVVGNSWADPDNGNGTTVYAHGFAWNQTDGTTDLGSLFANINRSTRANAVSADGNVIVGLQDLNGPWKSAVWRKNPEGGYFPNEYILVDPSGSATDEFNQLGECSTVTPDGNWIGGEGSYSNSNQPWIWSESTGLINLGDLTEGVGFGRVAGISPDGSFAIGWFTLSDWGSAPIPFIWTAEYGIHEFNDFVTNVLNIDTGGYEVWIPNNMSMNAKYITGWGVNPNIGEFGEVFAFRLEMPDTLGNGQVQSNISTVYPNPVNATLNIKSDSTIDKVEVYNVNGQLLLEEKSAAGISSIDMSSLANGIYFVKTYANQQTKTHKVTKQ